MSLSPFQRADRVLAATYLIPATLYLLWLGYDNWNDVTRWIATTFFERPDRGFVRGVLGDFRLLIEVLTVFFAASVVERILSVFPREDH